MSFAGNQYPNYADKVITTRGDMVRGDASGDRERLGIGSANQILQSDGTDPAWATLSTAASVLTTQGDILYEGAAGLARLGQSTDGHVLTTKGAAANPVWAAAGGGSLELIEAHTFDGSETAHIFTTDINFNTTYSDMIAVFHGLTASSTTMSLRTNGRTINYYSVSRKNGTATTSSNAVEAFVMDGMGGTYANICVIHCITALKPAGTFMGSNDVGQNVITGGFGNTNNNTDAGILTEFELRFDNAPTSTAQALQYGVKMT